MRKTASGIEGILFLRGDCHTTFIRKRYPISTVFQVRSAGEQSLVSPLYKGFVSLNDFLAVSSETGKRFL